MHASKAGCGSHFAYGIELNGRRRRKDRGTTCVVLMDGKDLSIIGIPTMNGPARWNARGGQYDHDNEEEHDDEDMSVLFNTGSREGDYGAPLGRSELGRKPQLRGSGNGGRMTKEASAAVIWLGLSVFASLILGAYLDG